jgi:hypothetical protein
LCHANLVFCDFPSPPPQAWLRFLFYPPSPHPFPFACSPKSIIFCCGCLGSRDYGLATVYGAWGLVRLILQGIRWVAEVLFSAFLFSISLHMVELFCDQSSLSDGQRSVSTIRLAFLPFPSV